MSQESGKASSELHTTLVRYLAPAAMYEQTPELRDNTRLQSRRRETSRKWHACVDLHPKSNHLERLQQTSKLLAEQVLLQHRMKARSKL